MQSPLIYGLITGQLKTNDGKYHYSTIRQAIEQARLTSNRNEDGKFIHPGRFKLNTDDPFPFSPASWSSALLYLVALEGIGTCFKNVKRNRVSGKHIYRAIRHFSEIEEKQAKAIETLRHSFVHNFGLCNKNSERMLTHIFILVSNQTSPLVEFGEQWHGTYGLKPENMFTKINIWKLQDFAEKVYLNLKAEYEADNIMLDISEHQAIARFTFSIHEDGLDFQY